MRRAQPVTLNTAQRRQLGRYALGRQVAVRLALRAKELLGNNIIMLIGFSGENLVVPLAMKLISAQM